jgi:hypothetical protein
MFIELTDHLRCPAEHAESFLVLFPHVMEGRRVVRGVLGCPVCQAEYPIVAGVAELGEPPTWSGVRGSGSSSLAPDGLLALLGLEGPGGFLALVGTAAQFGAELAELLPGVQCVAINPPSGFDPAGKVSLVQAARWPLRVRSMRGVVIAGGAAADPEWRDRAARSVLPGLRIVGEGQPPVGDLLAAAGGWWVLRGAPADQ